MATLITGGSLIQSSFGADGAHNLEAVIARPHHDGRFDLQHYWRLTNRPDAYWNTGATLPVDAAGPAAICQRGNHGGVHGNFEVVVPVVGGLAHLWCDNDPASASGWHRVVDLAAPGATGPGAIVENRATGDLELAAVHDNTLIHHRFDRRSWRPVAVVSHRITGVPALIQSDFGDNLELVVPEGGDSRRPGALPKWPITRHSGKRSEVPAKSSRGGKHKPGGERPSPRQALCQASADRAARICCCLDGTLQPLFERWYPDLANDNAVRAAHARAGGPCLPPTEYLVH
jgi:hypothetical protein